MKIQKENVIKSIIFFISIVVLFVLIFSSPAQAYILSLISSTPVIEKGDSAKFTSNVFIEFTEENPAYLTFKLNHDNSSLEYICIFDINGKKISTCKGLKIKKLKSPPNSEYGKTYIYEFNLDSSDLKVGTYSSSIILTNSEEEKIVAGDKIKIINPPMKSCSLRAKDSTIFVEDNEFLGKQLSFYIPEKVPEKGKGYLIGRVGRTSFSYRFENIRIINNTEESIELQVSGYYKIGREEKVFDSGIITLNRDTNKVSFVGDKIVVNDMTVFFKKGC